MLGTAIGVEVDVVFAAHVAVGISIVAVVIVCVC